MTFSGKSAKIVSVQLNVVGNNKNIFFDGWLFYETWEAYQRQFAFEVISLLQFILGVIIGGIVGFLVCALLKNTDYDNNKKMHVNEKQGDTNDTGR